MNVELNVPLKHVDERIISYFCLRVQEENNERYLLFNKGVVFTGSDSFSSGHIYEHGYNDY